MRMGWAVAFAALVASGFALSQQAVSLEYNYPWCTSGAGHEFGAVNCGFTTFEQCLATAQGNGQSCGLNPSYVPPPSAAAGKHPPRRAKTSR